MRTVLVTGANRGIGLEFVRQYASDGAKVIACARDPEGADDLKQLATEHSQIEIRTLDTSDLRPAPRWANSSRTRRSTSSSTTPAPTAPSARAPTTWISRAGPTRSPSTPWD